MAAGTAYAKRYAGGFVDGSGGGTPLDSVFFNAVEAALLQLIAAAPSADAQVMQWDNTNTRYGPALLLNKNIDPAAAIAKSKLDLTGANGIVNADVAGAAAIAYSKLNLANSIVTGDIVDGTIANADINAAAAIALSKLAGYPTDVTQLPHGDGTWKVGGQDVIDDLTVTGSVLATYDTNTRLGGVLPTTYKHLRLIVMGRGDTAAGSVFLQMRFNNDSGANYADQSVSGNAAAAAAGENSSATSFPGVGKIAAATATAGHAGILVMDIPVYNGTTWFKQFYSSSFVSATLTAGNRTIYDDGGVWANTAALTRLALFPAAGNFAIGTRFTLYGVN